MITLIQKKTHKKVDIPIYDDRVYELCDKYHYKFPKAASKKGLQVSAEMLEDAAELNVQHSVLNIVISDLLVNEKEKSGANTM